MTTNKRAFTLIELMVVIAIIGITLTFAIPLYTTMVNKVKVSELVNKLGTFKTQLVDAYTANTTWPGTLNGVASGSSAADSQFPSEVSFRYNTTATQAWWGYQLAASYGSGWIFMLIVNNGDGTFAVHCGALSTSCTFGSCTSAQYFPTACAETDLSTTFSLPDS